MALINFDTLMHVLSFCDTITLMSCARVSEPFRMSVTIEFRIRLALLLEPFVDGRLQHFFGLLRLHNAIISGSTALAFFLSPTDWAPGDLDVYVGDADYDAFVVDFERVFPVTLEADFGSRQPEAYTGISHVRRYQSASGRRLEIIQSRSPYALSPLFYFWSSVVVNFITPHGAVCGFPDHTLSEEGFVTNTVPTHKAASAREKYEGRGITFFEVPYWRRGGGRSPDGNRIFSIAPLLVLDFLTLWPEDPTRLPVVPTHSGWLMKTPPVQVAQGAATPDPRLPIRSASVGRPVPSTEHCCCNHGAVNSSARRSQ